MAGARAIETTTTQIIIVENSTESVIFVCSLQRSDDRRQQVRENVNRRVLSRGTAARSVAKRRLSHSANR